MFARFACLAALAAVLIGALPAAAQEPVSFLKQVAPIFVKQCVLCHGARDAKGEYQLHTFEALLATESVVAGKPDESTLLQRLIDEDPEVRMPKDGDKLPDDQIELVKRWIAEGAKFDGTDPKAVITSLVPKEPHPAAPEAYPSPVPITAVAFHPSGGELAVGGYHEVTIWNPADGKLLRRIGNVAQRVYALRYSQDGNLLAVASGNPGQLGEVRLYNPADGSLVKDLATMSDCAFDVEFDAGGTRLAACGADRSIRLFDVASGQELLLIEDHADWVMSIAFSPDGKLLVSASRDKTSKVFDLEKKETLATFNAHNEAVYGCAFNADGSQIFTCGADRQIRVWKPADAGNIGNIGGFGGECYELLLRGDQVYCCSADRTVRQFNAGNRSQVRVFQGHADWVFAVDVHPDSKRAASGSYDGEVRLWNLEDGMPVLNFIAAPGYVPPAAQAQN